MHPVVFHSFASTRKCYSQLFTSCKKEEKRSIFRSALLVPKPSFSFIRTLYSYSAAATVHFLLCDFSPLVNWRMHCYYNQHKACSLSSFTITFATSQQYRTYLSTASVWFSHSSELLSLPKSAAQLALLLEWPVPLLGVGEEDRRTNNNKTKSQLEPNTRFLYRQENWSRKGMYLQEKKCQHQ